MSNDDRKPTTTDAGIPVSSDEYSLTVGPDGPILLQDHYLMEQMDDFNREMIPARQPHAKGSGAFGYFEVTQEVSTYFKAALNFSATSRRLSIQSSARGSTGTTSPPISCANTLALFLEN